MYIFVTFIIFLAALYWFFKNELKFWGNRDVPFAKGHIIIGNMGETLLMKKSLAEIHIDLYKQFKGNKYCGYFHFRKPSLLILDSDLVKDILIKDFNKFHDGPILIDKKKDPILSKNPFFLRGQEWKLIRGQLTPQFTSGKIKAMFPLMEEVGNNLAKYLATEPLATTGDGLNAKDLANKFTADCVASCAFGMDGKSFVDPRAEFLDLGKNIFKFSYTDTALFMFAELFPEIRKLKSLVFIKEDVAKVFREIVLANVKQREADGIQRGDFLDVILELKRTTRAFDYNIDYMVAHAMTFFLDGFETSSIVLQFIYYELGSNLDVQKKLREEIERVVLENGGKLTYDTIQEMKYLDMVVQETLRMYPPIGALMRECTETTILEPAKTGGKRLTVEKGMPIYIPVMALHYDPEYYTDPEKFHPERFEEKLPGKYAYLPFGEGPRMCLGRRFGLTQIKVALVATVRNFEIRVNKKTKVPLQIDPLEFILAVKGGIWVNFYALSSN